MRYVIGIDIGTTNTKAVAYTEHGQVLASAESSYPVFTDSSGMHELEPSVLFDAVLQVLLQVTEHSTAKEKPFAVGLSCAMHSLILVDSGGNPLTRALTWADRRSEAVAERLKASDAGRRIYRQTRVPIHAMSPLCKLLWLKEQDATLFRRAARFISIKEYIWWRFFGKYQVDLSIASATGLLDIRQPDWNRESLAIAGIHPGQLSELVSTTHRETVLLPAWRALGFSADMPFVIGASDGCLANLGTGAVHPGETALTIGTSGAVRMATRMPQFDASERLFSYILTKDLYITGGATNNGGNAVQWYADLVFGKGRWDMTALDGLVGEAEAVVPGCEGLIFLPYLLGERAPVWDAEAKAVYFGVRSIHDRRHFMRAVLEGVAYSLRQIGTSLEETIGPIGNIHASGGFTQSPFWLQLIADVFSKTVKVNSVVDASATGAAMLAWIGLGVLGGPAEAAALVRTEAVFHPDAHRHVAYESNYRVFTQLYGRLKDLM
ncbi:MAG TPA: gluconokinase [Puia sp.]|nr:gluconokinase [Puia sp.]